MVLFTVHVRRKDEGVRVAISQSVCFQEGVEGLTHSSQHRIPR
jgi:hypothetical protein